MLSLGGAVKPLIQKSFVKETKNGFLRLSGLTIAHILYGESLEDEKCFFVNFSSKNVAICGKNEDKTAQARDIRANLIRFIQKTF